MAMTRVFAKALMASEDIQSFVGSCKFGAGDTAADFAYDEIYDGAFVNIGALCHDDVYSTVDTEYLDWNVHMAVAPDADHLTTKDICVIDIANISEVDIFGNHYKGIDTRLVNLTRPAGTAVRFRRLAHGDKFWLGLGNFFDETADPATATFPEIGQFGNVNAGETFLTVDDAATADQFAVLILASKPLTMGQSVQNFGDATTAKWEELYLCEVQ